MAFGKAPFDSNQFVKFLVFGLVVIFFITQIINIGAIGSSEKCLKVDTTTSACSSYSTETTCNAKSGCEWGTPAILREDVDYDNIVPQTFKWLILAITVYIVWFFVLRFSGRWDKKDLISLILYGVALYIVYAYLLQPLLPDVLPSLKFAAWQLQSISPPAIQGIMGIP